MIDKQIIIDGVDVSGCCQYMPRYMEDYDIDTLDYCRYHFKPCKDVDVKYCYYKQLKRKEQECEELKKTIMYKCPQCGDEYLSPIGAGLYEENNKLKQTIAEIIRFFKEDKKFARYSGYPIIFTKQALDEIENITKRYCKE